MRLPELTWWWSWEWRLIPRNIRFLFQIITRGWCDADTWSLDHTIAKFTLPRLKRFKQLKCGSPCGKDGEAIKNWDEIIDELTFFFGEIANDKAGCPYDAGEEEIDKYYKRLKVASKYLGKYFRSLWW